jgi:catechol 2,3-dioxygenase-like lactoylglutathione lyase family enzyme
MRLHSTVLITTQLSVLRKFYTKTLGFRVIDDFGACIVLDCGISIWEPGNGHAVHAQRRVKQSRRFPFELCLEADTAREFDLFAKKLERSGLPLLHGVKTEAWGQRTLRLQDPDGNLLEWGESIPCFVRRLHRAGNSVSEVASTTGIAAQRVRTLIRAKAR